MLLIFEWLAIHTLTAHACPCRITRLYYETGYDSVKDDSVVVAYESEL